MSYSVRQKDFEINELTIAVNDLRGKFVKPTLKKVSKTQGKFAKIQKDKTTKIDLRQNLKNVGKNQFALDDEVSHPLLIFRSNIFRNLGTRKKQGRMGQELNFNTISFSSMLSNNNHVFLLLIKNKSLFS